MEEEEEEMEEVEVFEIYMLLRQSGSDAGETSAATKLSKTFYCNIYENAAILGCRVNAQWPSFI